MSLITTIPKITSAQQKQMAEDGFLIVEDLISSEEVENLKQEALDLARGKYPSEALKPLPQNISDEEALKRILCIHNPQGISPVIRSWVHHPAIAEVLSKTVKAHLPASYQTGTSKCVQSMFFVKAPGKPGQAWHQDEAYLPTRDRSLTGCWIALDDASVDNGCLWVIPGSHRQGILYPQQDHDRADEWDFSQVAYGDFDVSKEVPVELKAGSAVFFNGYLLHSSRKNRSGIYRRALVNHYMSSESFYPYASVTPRHGDRDSIPQAAARYDWRGVMHVSGQDPYVNRGYIPFTNDVHLRETKQEYENRK